LTNNTDLFFIIIMQHRE